MPEKTIITIENRRAFLSIGRNYDGFIIQENGQKKKTLHLGSRVYCTLHPASVPHSPLGRLIL